MADPVSFAAAGVGIADVALRVIMYLKDVKAAADNIEDDIGILIGEVEGLCDVHQQLEHDFHKNVRNKVLGNEEKMLWFSIGQILQKGQKLTQKLEVSIKKIYGDNPKVMGKRDGLIKEHRRQNNNPFICGMRDQIGAYHRMLQIGLSRISMHSAHERRENQEHQFQELSKLVKDIENRLEQMHESTLQSQEAVSASAAYKDFTTTSLAILNDITTSIHSTKGSFIRPPTVNKHFYTPKPVDQFYTGRSEQAEKLKKWLLAEETQDMPKSNPGVRTKQKRFVIYGVGGAGKTQFCCKFAEDCQQYFWGVFWVDGSSSHRLKQTFAQHVSKIGGVESNENAALHWLSNQTEPWLLIIDNADDPDLELDDYFPRGENRGHILITTRSPFHKSYGTVGARFFEFQGLKMEEASCLLLRAADQQQPWDLVVSKLALTIAKTLGYLALAITQAGRTIRNKYCKLHEYVGYYERQWQKTRQGRQAVKGRDAVDDMSVFATFEINRRAIEDRDDEASKDALQLLSTFAFLHNQNIRFDMLARAVTNERVESAHQEEIAQKEAQVVRAGRKSKEFDPDRSRVALRQLEHFSLIIHSEKTDSYSLHPLVHKWARERPDMSIAEQSVWSEAAAVLISHCILIPPLGNAIEDEEIRGYLLPHVEHVRECQASIEQRMRDKRIARMKPWPLFECTFSREKAIRYAKFSLVYAQNGRWEEAKRLQMAVRDFTVKVLGMEHTSTRRITLVLADTMKQLGQTDDAAALEEEVLNACSTFVGPESLETLTTKCKLGMSRYQQGRISAAEKILREAVESMEKHHGPEHEDTLDAKDNLGHVTVLFLTEKSIKEARKLHLEAVRGMETKHGQQHARTLLARERLCMTAVESKDPSQLLEACKMMTEVLELRKEKLGREHGFTLIAMANLARVKSALHDLKGAEELLQEGLLIGERNYGSDHIGCLWGRYLLGKLRVQEERWQDAERVLVDVTERQRNLLQGRGKYHPDRLGGLVELATVYHALGRIDECVRVATEALEGFAKISVNEHPIAANLKVDMEGWLSERNKEGRKDSALNPVLRSVTF